MRAVLPRSATARPRAAGSSTSSASTPTATVMRTSSWLTRGDHRAGPLQLRDIWSRFASAISTRLTRIQPPVNGSAKIPRFPSGLLAASTKVSLPVTSTATEISLRKQLVTVTERNRNRKRKSHRTKGPTGRGKPRAKSALPISHAGRKADAPRLIIGIGASAGGLEAFRKFFAVMPADSGMAFVLVQHLDPHHKSMLVDLLGRHTQMKVVEAADGMRVAANRIFIIPPNATLTIVDERSAVTKPAPVREHRRPIDTFFASLAEDQGECAVCIVLSGTGSDGTLGLRKVKEHGGLSLAQADTDATAMSGMPQKRSGHRLGRSHHSRGGDAGAAHGLSAASTQGRSAERCRRQPPRYVCAPGIDLTHSCAKASAMTSASTSTIPCCGGFSAACRCCASTQRPPSSNGCARSPARSTCCFGNS